MESGTVVDPFGRGRGVGRQGVGEFDLGVSLSLVSC